MREQKTGRRIETGSLQSARYAHFESTGAMGKKMKSGRKLFHRICSDKGESIGEALAAMLIVALGALMLAAMTSAATRIVTKSEKAYAEYLDQRNIIESGNADNIEKNSSGESSEYNKKVQNGHLSLGGTEDGMAATAQENVTITTITDSTGKIKIATYRHTK